MGRKRFQLTLERDPDWGCPGCPYRRGRVQGHICVKSRRNIDGLAGPAPDWCELRKLPDIEPGK